jgi:hypothetical protein
MPTINSGVFAPWIFVKKLGARLQDAGNIDGLYSLPITSFFHFFNQSEALKQCQYSYNTYIMHCN